MQCFPNNILFLEAISASVGQLMFLIWASYDVCHERQKLRWTLSHVYFVACDGPLRFTSGQKVHPEPIPHLLYQVTMRHESMHMVKREY